MGVRYIEERIRRHCCLMAHLVGGYGEQTGGYNFSIKEKERTKLQLVQPGAQLSIFTELKRKLTAITTLYQKRSPKIFSKSFIILFVLSAILGDWPLKTITKSSTSLTYKQAMITSVLIFPDIFLGEIFFP